MIKTLQHCLRCDKELYGDDVHTCTPSKKYRAGMEEGKKALHHKLEKAISYIKNRIDRARCMCDVIGAHCFKCEGYKLLNDLNDE